MNPHLDVSNIRTPTLDPSVQDRNDQTVVVATGPTTPPTGGELNEEEKKILAKRRLRL
jgi:hypothetical protein